MFTVCNILIFRNRSGAVWGTIFGPTSESSFSLSQFASETNVSLSQATSESYSPKVCLTEHNCCGKQLINTK